MRHRSRGGPGSCGRPVRRPGFPVRRAIDGVHDPALDVDRLEHGRRRLGHRVMTLAEAARQDQRARRDSWHQQVVEGHRHETSGGEVLDDARQRVHDPAGRARGTRRVSVVEQHDGPGAETGVDPAYDLVGLAGAPLPSPCGPQHDAQTESVRGPHRGSMVWP